VLLIVAPIIAYLITKRICLALQKKDREIALHGFESGRIVRLPGGEYIEVHEQLDDYERWKLVSFNDYKPLMVRPDAQGRITGRQRLRAAMSTWFFEDRIEPPTRTEVERSNALH
jgi:ubiquinol-cytochrome c reductase cytochrome b subunit